MLFENQVKRVIDSSGGDRILQTFRYRVGTQERHECCQKNNRLTGIDKRLFPEQMPERRLDVFRMQIGHDVFQRSVLQQQAVRSGGAP
jgi:hypothetical protein